MPEISFRYRHVKVPPSAAHPDGQTLRNPKTVATLTASNGKTLRVFVLLDTGADACCFPLTYALLLGIDVQSLPMEMTGGIGSMANVTYYDTVQVDLGQGVVFTAKAAFMEGMNMHAMGLLGQDGFFSSFDVHFSHKTSTFTIITP